MSNQTLLWYYLNFCQALIPVSIIWTPNFRSNLVAGSLRAV